MKTFIFSILSLSLFFSCNKKDEELPSLPPEDDLIEASPDFEILEAFSILNDNPNFKDDDTVFVRAKFNEKVSVVVIFVGRESNAKRIIRVDTNLLDRSLFWRGEHEGMNFFRSNERVDISFYIKGAEAITDQELTIQCPYDYRRGRNNALYRWSFESDCDIEKNIYFFSSYGSPDRPKIVDSQSPNGMRVLSIYSDTSKIGFRNGATYRGGRSIHDKFIFFNGPIDERNTEEIDFTADPNNVWFNFYIKGMGYPKSRAVIALGEVDCPDNIDCESFRTYRDFEQDYWRSHDRLRDDRVIKEIEVNFNEWKLISLRYSDTPFSINQGFGGNGNKIYEPHRLQFIDFSLESDIPGPAGYLIDFPIITFGGPFDPTKL